jgi:DNA primase large subunit
MKKIIAVLTLLFAFSVSANAQDKKVTSKTEIAKPELTIEDLAKRDAEELAKFVGLDSEKIPTYTRLFQKKYKVMSNPGLTKENKTELVSSIEAKLRAGLTPEQIEKLDKNPALLKKLTE